MKKTILTSRVAFVIVTVLVATMILASSPLAHAEDGFGGDFGGGIEGFGGDFGGGYDGFGNGFGGGYDGFGGDFGGGYDGFGNDFGGGYDGFGNDFGGGYGGYGGEFYPDTEFYPDAEFYPDSEFYPDGEFYPDSEYGDDGVYYDGECGCYAYGDEYDYEVTDTYGSYSSPSYSSGGSKGFSIPSFSSSGYSQAKPITFGSPSYPAYNPPAKTTGGNSSVSNISNTTITNVDNSINDSFNNYNSGNVYVAPLSYATPEYPVVYNYPTYKTPYCQIYQATAASGYGVNAVYLSWTSSNASSAYLSNVGSVNVNGSTTVWPSGAATYTLTVYGSNGQSAQCQVAVSAYAAPYVSLTQIPYTGFDLGTFGNAMYWAGLLVFALGAGYLAVYYIPALAFAGVRTRKFAPVVAPKAPILVQKETIRTADGVQSIAHPVMAAIRKAGTNDTMAIVASKDGSMPKIVISRE